MMFRAIIGVLLRVVAAFLIASLFIHAASAQGRASVSDIAGRPNAVIVNVPSDPCGFLYEQMPSRLREIDLDFGPVKLDKRALFTHYCDEKKDELAAVIRAPFENAQKNAQDALDRITGELTAGFWKYVAELLYERLPAEERAKYRQGSPELDALAHDWLNEAPKEAGTYAAAYLTAGGQESRIYNAWKAYVDLTNGESKNVLGEMQNLLKVTQQRLRQVVNAGEELADPDTSAVDALEGVGLSGEWLDNLKSYEGELRGLNSSYRITDAMQIVSSAMGSEQPSDKVRAFFELMKISGAIASESRAPLFAFVGDIIQQYATAAAAVLDSAIALENQIAKRNGFCLGVGVPSRDPRHVFFVDRNILACPLAYGTWPFKHIYQSQGAATARLFFYNGDGFTESTNGANRDAIVASLALINGAIDLGYPLKRDPDDHVARLAEVYNTSHPGGVPALMSEAGEMVGDIRAAVEAIRALHLAGDSCSQDSVLTHLARTSGLSPENFARDTTNDDARLINAIAASFVAFEGRFGPEINRGANAYETYQQLADKMRQSSVLVLEGRVVDQRRNLVPGAFIEVRVSGGDEVRGCEAWQADGSGRFQVYAVGQPGLNMSVRAETQSERGDAETFDTGYFERIGTVVSDPNRAVVARASGDVVLNVESRDEPEAENGDAAEKADEDNVEGEGVADTDTVSLAECSALDALVSQNAVMMNSGLYFSKNEVREALNSAIESAGQSDVCDPEIRENALVQLLSLDEAIQREREIAAAVNACEPEIVQEQLRVTQANPKLINTVLIEYLVNAEHGLNNFDKGRAAYLANKLSEAESLLRNALEEFGALPGNVCASYKSRAEKGLANIAEIRGVREKLDTAISACSISGLQKLRDAIGDQTHPAFDVFRERIAVAITKCDDQQRLDAAEAACNRAEQSLDTARADYRANRLDRSEQQLLAILASFDKESLDTCPAIIARAKRGLENIAAIRAQEASLNNAIGQCNIDQLKDLRSKFSAQKHLWFRNAIGMIDKAIPQCENDHQDEPGNVCQQIADLGFDAGQAYEGGNFQAALKLALEAQDLSRDISQMSGCEDDRPIIAQTVADFERLIDGLAAVNQAVEACDVEGFASIRDNLEGHDHAIVESALTRLEIAAEDCAGDAANDPPPAVAAPDSPQDSSDSAGALAVMRDIERKLTEALRKDPIPDVQFTRSQPTGNRNQANIAYKVLSIGRTNDVASSRTELSARVMVAMFPSETDAILVPRADETMNRHSKDIAFGDRSASSGDAVLSGSTRFSKGKYQVEVIASRKSYTALSGGDPYDDYPSAGILSLMIAKFYSDFIDIDLTGD